MRRRSRMAGYPAALVSHVIVNAEEATELTGEQRPPAHAACHLSP